VQIESGDEMNFTLESLPDTLTTTHKENVSLDTEQDDINTVDVPMQIEDINNLEDAEKDEFVEKKQKEIKTMHFIQDLPLRTFIREGKYSMNDGKVTLQFDVQKVCYVHMF
jgi:hypothetical protein